MVTAAEWNGRADRVVELVRAGRNYGDACLAVLPGPAADAPFSARYATMALRYAKALAASLAADRQAVAARWHNRRPFLFREPRSIEAGRRRGRHLAPSGVVEVGVPAPGGLQGAVAEQVGDPLQPLAVSEQPGRDGAPQVMQVNVR